MNFPEHFTVVSSIRKDKKLGEVARNSLFYKGELIAIFEDKNFNEVDSWLKTYGYLAEWIYQKSIHGKYVDWNDTMYVHLHSGTK